MFSEQELTELLELLGRSTLQGKEAPAFMKLIQKIQDEIQNRRGSGNG